MEFLKDLKQAWELTKAERAWKKRFKRKSVPTEKLAEKEAATAKGEPWVDILRMDVDPENLSDGAFELDWNDIFVARLVKAGYSGRNDQAIVDQWFQNLCAGIVAEEYEQEIADPDKFKRIRQKRIDSDRTEVS